MTYYEFRDKYNGQYVDVDGYPSEWKWQCFDLVQLYITECLGLPDYILAGCGVVKNMLYSPKRELLDEFFYEVPITEMEAGDICFWDFGDAGHTAIYDSWDGQMCYFFSQNPNPSQVMFIDLPNLHAFRKRQPEPPQPIVPTVPRDEYKDQIEVIVPELNVRTSPSIEGNKIGFAPMGIYNYYEVLDNDGYTWYKIADLEWIASKEGEWTKVYPKKEDEYVQFKILDKKDGYALIDLGKTYVKIDK